MPILIKNESFNNIFLWKLCFIENNYFLCIVKLKKRSHIYPLFLKFIKVCH